MNLNEFHRFSLIRNIIILVDLKLSHLEIDFFRKRRNYAGSLPLSEAERRPDLLRGDLHSAGLVVLSLDEAGIILDVLLPLVSGHVR